MLYQNITALRVNCQKGIVNKLTQKADEDEGWRIETKREGIERGKGGEDEYCIIITRTKWRAGGRGEGKGRRNLLVQASKNKIVKHP